MHEHTQRNREEERQRGREITIFLIDTERTWGQFTGTRERERMSQITG